MPIRDSAKRADRPAVMDFVTTEHDKTWGMEMAWISTSTEIPSVILADR